MSLKTSTQLPPNIKEIQKVCNPDLAKTVFTYGDCVYNVQKPLEDHLEQHEMVHVKQQVRNGVEEWWKKYLASPQFRLEQELQAYVVQYNFIKQKYPKHAKRCLFWFASDLSGSLYGRLLTYQEAEKRIKNSPMPVLPPMPGKTFLSWLWTKKR